MLTNHLLSYYNHLIATSLVYIAMVDPVRDISNSLYGRRGRHASVMNLVLASNSNLEADYYETLGVNKDATKQEIHRAFRQLAKKYHPDKNKDKSASDEFIKIFKAYETLSDEKKRREYDDYRNSHAGAWTTASPNNAYDFDINDFFKQYEDQFLRHAQQHHQHHHHDQQYYHEQYHQNLHNQMHRNQFKYHGINLDELFHDIDEDEFSSFGRWFDGSSHDHNHFHQPPLDGHFGDGASFFGSHFSSGLHNTMNQYHQQHNFQGHGGIHRGGYSCQTTTRQVNGMVMTQTSCS